MKTVQNNQGPRQPRLVYYEPDHDGRVSDILAGVMALRGYKLTSDEAMLDRRGPAVLRDSSGVLQITDGTRNEPLKEVEWWALPLSYANAIADWFDEAKGSHEIPGDWEEQGAHLYFCVGAWIDRNKPGSLFYPESLKDAMETIDELLPRLQQLRSALLREGKAYAAELRAEAERLCEKAEEMVGQMSMGNPENGLLEAMISAAYGEAGECDRKADAIDPEGAEG